MRKTVLSKIASKVYSSCSLTLPLHHHNKDLSPSESDGEVVVLLNSMEVAV